ncbi:probable serine incorporator isoform X1 [Amborella trichopoda]|uniref:probable serine incorporator isoform X1 n=1 Tax=Amborella trichopoda TaxID=13333 RepID=UPI0009BF8320|nr:probable serine incorporator isoform X1 [Amborella trichopoda]XP_020529110.1 probable serine incorporator isoform X1 [Amborella trichopoda]|eukprot:XP_020529109.1 probable serine incorporator isoform X1 [Amborella trichopoda]
MSESKKEVDKGNGRNLELVSWEQSLAQPDSVNYPAERKASLRARYVYGFIFLLTNLLAWFFRDYGDGILTELRYLKGCQGGEECLHAEGVLRISLGCFIFFFFMFITTFRITKFHESCNFWHTGWWSLKCILLIASLLASFFIPSASIHLYGEVARFGAGVFLVVQLVSVIQFINWCDSYWMRNEKLKQRFGRFSIYFFGLFLSTVAYIAAICGILVMFLKYVRGTACPINIFFISWTIVLLLVMMIVALHSKVNTGLLSSGIMGAYIVFLCWSAIRSEPDAQQCSMRKEMVVSNDWTTVLSFLIAISAIVMATFSTGIDSQSFQFRKVGIQSEDSIPYNYGFFHIVFSLGAMYFSMLLINWDLDHSTQKWSIDVGWASTWVKIVNEWFAASIYLWKLVSPLLKETKNMNGGESVSNSDGST